jgi:antitoxin component YwqK of YwqJK toxin-antitoxin module
MPKSFLLIFIGAFVINTTKGQGQDTLISYFKYDLNGYYGVSNINEADFYRMILPPDPGDSLKNIKEYYRNGKIKLVGKFDPKLNEDIQIGFVFFSGDCICFYPNGKKQSITQYTRGQKDGNEYLFYPNGTTYCYKKNIAHNGYYSTKNWECHDINGTMMCSEGNGQWIEYDRDLKNVFNTGPVKNGHKEGEWHCRSEDADSIKYICRFNKGVAVSGVGFDKNGVAYPFTKQAEMANYRNSVVTFIEVFRSHLKLPKDLDGKKMSVDTVHICFVIEKDGKVSGFKTLGNVNTELGGALAEAFAKCGDWMPSRVYGIPLRTEVIFPVKLISGFKEASWTKDYHNQYYQKEVGWKFRILGF